MRSPERCVRVKIQSVRPDFDYKAEVPIVRLCLDRYPNLVTAKAGSPIEFLAVIFEVRRIDSLVAGLGEPFCPDRHFDVMHGRDVFGCENMA